MLVAVCPLLGRAHAQPAVEPVEPRMDAVFGRAVVFRVRPSELPPPPIIAVRLDDGRTIEGDVQWVRVIPPGGGPCAGPTWLPPPPVLEAAAAGDADAGRGAGAWMMRLRFPLEASGQGFWLGGVRYQPNWLPDPRRLVDRGMVGRAWSSPLVEDERADALLSRLTEPYRDHPLHGWRHDLMMDVFTPGEEFDQPEDGGPIEDLDALRAEIEAADPFEPITRDLADLERARWQVALARLWNADPTLSLPVRDRLVGIIETSGGLLPAWTVDQPVIDDLLGALLDPDSSDERVAGHIRAWLDGFDDAIAWVIDDAGRQDGISGEFLPTIGVVNTAERSVLAWARASDVSSPSDLTPLLPGRVQMLRGEILPTDFRRPELGPGVEVQVGGWDGYLQALGVAIPVSPPGFALGPLRAAWTLEAWSAMDDGEAVEVARDRSAAVMLARGPVFEAPSTVVGPAPRASGRQAWTLYVEARSAGDGTADDFVELWFGPHAMPSAVLRIYSDGRVVDTLAQENAGDLSVKIVRLADRWVARLPVPTGAIEAGPMLRLGVLREDGCGSRSSWPRRMLPGQTEPGRVAVRLDAWDEYATR